MHCLHEIFFDAAIKHAQALDQYYKEHKKPIGPLHGLPISLKDQFHIKDVETTMGYVGWIGTFQGKTGTGKEKVFESEIVKELRKAGAVLYCKTSVPHTLMSGETVNNIIGYTLNGKNRRLASGGSSGGEGALIGVRGCKSISFSFSFLPVFLEQNTRVKKERRLREYIQRPWVSAPTSVALSASQQPSTVSTASVPPPAVFHTKAWQTQWTARTASSPS